MERDMTKLVEEITAMLNGMESVGTKAVIMGMQNQHRTLQQSFTRLCVKWLTTCASDEYRYDGRNEASHILGKKIVEAFGPDGDLYLPFI